MLRRTAIALTVLGATLVAPAGAASASAGPGEAAAVPCPITPVVIGHRGAWGFRPEHTLASYRVALAQGADYVEQDFISTKDGVLIARNSPELSTTTDVAARPEFAARKTTKVLDGVATTGWFSEDFTLREIKILRARERMPDIRPGNARFDGRFEIPTLQEVIDLVKAESIKRHRKLGFYPETKRPTYFRSIGLPLEPRLVNTLRRNGLTRPDAPVKVFLQSFEPSSLQRLNRMVDLPIAQLVDAVGKPYDFVVSGDPRTFADLVTPEGLTFVRGYADAVAVNKVLIVPQDAAGNTQPPTSLVGDAHKVGLQVHAWRFANENTFLPADFRVGTDPAAWGRFRAEYRAFFRLGVDAVITDFPGAADAVRRRCV